MKYVTETAGQLEAGSLDLALLALNELAKRKSKKSETYDKVDLNKFCTSIIEKDDDLQVHLIETLLARGINLNIIYEIFIPEAAETLGNWWKANKVTFIEVHLGSHRLQRLSRIYEKQYLGPMYIFSEGPEILLILPLKEVHTLGLITASGIFKKHGANPFVAVGYSDDEIISLINSRAFKLIGISIANSENISDCIKTAKYIKSKMLTTIPMVAGGQGITKADHNTLYETFDQLTDSPETALKLISENEYN